MSVLHKFISLAILLFISFPLIGQQNYTTIQGGAWNVQSNWDNNNIPPSTIGSLDTVFVNHDMTIHSDISILGYVVVDAAASITSNNKEKLKIGKGGTDLGELINYGTIVVDKIEVKPDNGCTPSMGLPTGYNYGNIHVDKLHVGNNCGAGSFYNYIGGKITIDKELHLDNYLCNQDTITVITKVKNHGGTIDCCGIIESPLVEIDHNGGRPGTFECIDMCNEDGSDDILKVDGTLYSSLTDAYNNAPASEVSFDDDSTSVCGLTQNGNSFLLPIRLKHFGTRITDNKTIINWTTLSESNNEYFTIEKSNDFKNWYTVTVTPSKGQSTAPIDYKVIDLHPYIGYTHYRLKQTDYNETYSYSEISTVFYSSKGSNVDVYPNPTNDIINISGDEEQLNHIAIWNAIGTELTSYVRINHSSKTMITIDITNLKSGIYYIRTGTVTQKVYKL